MAWLPLIGEYGAGPDRVIVLESGGRLEALIDRRAWTLTATAGAFRVDSGPYAGAAARFLRGAGGKVERLQLGGIAYPRRAVGTEAGVTFHIAPLHPVDSLRGAALAMHPPAQPAGLRQPDLVDVTSLDSRIKLDIRYATTNDFLGSAMYTSARAFLQRPAAEALLRALRWLTPQGYGLLIHDAYRPWYVTRMFWDATPDSLHQFVANPDSGSKHNRGCAVDLSLYDLRTGEPVRMVGGYDEFSPRSYADYPGGTSLQRWYRALLRRAMEREGFKVIPEEWWHFDYKDWRRYPVLNLSFEQLAARRNRSTIR
ncbi:MAG TPA: M15 family metallopeptidase [Gemmatimonadales bacterium]|nr:M15 family metallopeptidase [Gemmatimonadales bacterium]